MRGLELPYFPGRILCLTRAWKAEIPVTAFLGLYWIYFDWNLSYNLGCESLVWRGCKYARVLPASSSKRERAFLLWDWVVWNYYFFQSGLADSLMELRTAERELLPDNSSFPMTGLRQFSDGMRTHTHTIISSFLTKQGSNQGRYFPFIVFQTIKIKSSMFQWNKTDYMSEPASCNYAVYISAPTSHWLSLSNWRVRLQSEKGQLGCTGRGRLAKCKFIKGMSF